MIGSSGVFAALKSEYTFQTFNLSGYRPLMNELRDGAQCAAWAYARENVTAPGDWASLSMAGVIMYGPSDGNATCSAKGTCAQNDPATQALTLEANQMMREFWPDTS